MEVTAQHRLHGGTLGYYRHPSDSCRCDMNFTVFTPPQAENRPVPAVYWLSGLTCTEDNFTTKAGAYGVAAELGLMVVAADTSPRGPDRDGNDVPDDDAYDLGQGAGFYLDATQPPWNAYFNMYSYITRELPMLIAAICAPMQCAWGEKAFTAYLGGDRAAWANYDATALMNAGGDGSGRAEILVDQGLADKFLADQLHPHLLEDACATVDQKLSLRRHDGYDHSYFFIATVIGDHLRHHAKVLAD